MRALITSQEPRKDITVEEFEAIKPVILVEAAEYRDKVYSKLVKVWREHLAASERLRAADAAVGKERTERVPAATKQRKRKGKQKAEPVCENTPVMDLDPAAQLALLNEPTTIFNCSVCVGPWEFSRCQRYMSYIELMEHWRTQHYDSRCLTATVARDHERYAMCLPRLLDALGLDTNTTHAAMHELITSGRTSGAEPLCSCRLWLRHTVDSMVGRLCVDTQIQ